MLILFFLGLFRGIPDSEFELLSLLLAIVQLPQAALDFWYFHHLCQLCYLAVLLSESDKILFKLFDLHPQPNEMLVPLVGAEVIGVEGLIDLSLLVHPHGEGGLHNLRDPMKLALLGVPLEKRVGLLRRTFRLRTDGSKYQGSVS